MTTVQHNVNVYQPVCVCVCMCVSRGLQQHLCVGSEDGPVLRVGYNLLTARLTSHCHTCFPSHVIVSSHHRQPARDVVGLLKSPSLNWHVLARHKLAQRFSGALPCFDTLSARHHPLCTKDGQLRAFVVKIIHALSVLAINYGAEPRAERSPRAR